MRISIPSVVLSSMVAAVALASFAQNESSVTFEETKPIVMSPTGAIRTFAAARDEVRSRRAAGTLGRGKVTVLVKSGRYFVDKPVVFGEQDAGTVEVPVEFVAEGDVIVDGGVELPAGRPLAETEGAAVSRVRPELRDRVMAVRVKAPGATKGILPRILGSDGEPYEYARYPKTGWLRYERIPKLEKGVKATVAGYSDERISSWTDEPDVRAYGYPVHDWAPAAMTVFGIDPTNRTFSSAGSGYGLANGRRWFARNVLHELSKPGECVLDAKAGALYYVPRPADVGKGLTMAKTKAFVRMDKTGFVSFRGFHFRNFQGEAIDIARSHDITVVGGSIRNCLNGLVAKESSRIRVSELDVSDIARGGIFLSGGDQYGLVESGNVVEKCRIRRVGTEYTSYSGGVTVRGCGGSVVSNDIAEISHAGVFFWGTCHRIVGNEIHDVCLESGEMGAVYTGRDWVLVGNVIEGNHFHDLPRTCRQPTRAIMLDDGAGGIEIRNNRFVRCAEGICTSGIGNVIENNVFEACAEAVGLWSCWFEPGCFGPSVRNNDTRRQRLAAAPVDSPVWKARFPWTSLLRDAVRDGTLRDPTTRTRIVGNTLVSYGKPQFHWCRPSSPYGYLITGNVEKLSPDAEAKPYFEFGTELSVGEAVPQAKNATMRTLDGPLVLAHRGGRHEYDDNAAGGFARSVRLGIRGYETDVRLSKDRELVIMHDGKLDRTTTGTGIVEDRTLKEIQQLKLKKCGETVPTAYDVLTALGRREDVFIELEMKSYPSAFYTPEVLLDYCTKLNALAKACLAPGTYCFTSFNTTTLKTMRKVDSSAPLGYIMGKLADEHLATAKELKCCAVAPTLGTSKEMVDKAHAAGLSVTLWMVETKEQYAEAKAKGADRVTSDHPVRLTEELVKAPADAGGDL